MNTYSDYIYMIKKIRYKIQDINFKSRIKNAVLLKSEQFKIPKSSFGIS